MCAFCFLFSVYSTVLLLNQPKCQQLTQGAHTAMQAGKEKNKHTQYL